MEEQKDYLYVIDCLEQVQVSYTVKASSDEDAIQKVNRGDYIDCDWGDTIDEDVVNPVIVSKDELD